MNKSVFLGIANSAWLVENEFAFAIYDSFPVSPGHSLVITKRVVPTWFDASPEEQAALMSLVNEVRLHLDATLRPTPDEASRVRRL